MLSTKEGRRLASFLDRPKPCVCPVFAPVSLAVAAWSSFTARKDTPLEFY